MTCKAKPAEEIVDQGRVTSVKTVKYGTYVRIAASSGATTVFIEDAAHFNEFGGKAVINGVTYSYSAASFSNDSLTLTSGLTGSVSAGARVDAYPSTVVKYAMVLTDNTGDSIMARVHQSLYDTTPEGTRAEDQREAAEITLTNDEWVLTNITGVEPVIDGGFIDPETMPPAGPPTDGSQLDPGTLPPEVVTSDGSAPSSSPTPTITPGINTLFVEWVETNPDPTTYDVYISTTNPPAITSANLAASVIGSMAFIGELPNGGGPLVRGTTYYVRIVARDQDGTAAPGPVAAGTPKFIETVDIDTAAVTNAKLGDLSVDATKLADGSVSAAKIVNEAIGTTKLVDGAVVAAKLADLAVQTSKIATDAITEPKIAANAIWGYHIGANEIIGYHVAAGSIDADEIAANAITANHVSAGAIGTDELAANSIVAGKIAAAQITTLHLASAAVTADKIAANSITASAIAANAITADKIASNSIIAGKIAASAVTSTTIAAGAIDGKTITGSLVQTTSTSSRGIKLASNGLFCYDSAGSLTFHVDATSGAVSAEGSFTARSGSSYARLTVLSFPRLAMFDAGTGYLHYIQSESGVLRLHHYGGNELRIGYQWADFTGGELRVSNNLNMQGTSIYNCATVATSSNITAGGLLGANGGGAVVDVGSDGHPVLRGAGTSKARVKCLNGPDGIQSRNGVDGSYAPIRASAFNVSSVSTYKDDIKAIPLSDADVDGVLDTTGLRSWRWKADPGARGGTVGLVADAMPMWLRDGDGYSVTAAIGFLWEATRKSRARVAVAESGVDAIDRTASALARRVDVAEADAKKAKDRLNQSESTIAALSQRVAQLEAKVGPSDRTP